MDPEAIALERRPPAPGLIRGAARVFRAQPLRVLRGRRLLGVLLLAFSPALLAALAFWVQESEVFGLRHFVGSMVELDLTVVFPVTLLLLAAAALGDEIEDGTVLYVRLRPLPRASVVLGRYLSAVCSAVVLLAPAVALRFCIQVVPLGGWLTRLGAPILAVALLAVFLGALCYGALFLLLSLLLRRAVLVGLFFVFGWETLVSSVVPGRAALFTVSFHLKALLFHVTDEGVELRRQMQPFLDSHLLPSPTTSVVGLLAAAAALVAVACVVFARREFLVRPGSG